MIHYNKKILLVISLIITLLLIDSCINITQPQAEAKALQFVKQNIKFFARDENSTVNLPEYTIGSITSYGESKNWVVLIHVSSRLGNEIKKNDLIIKLDNNGDIIEFNGKKVPR